MSASLASAAQQFAKKSNQKRRKNNPNELFVGNLSYFCEEQNLYDLFSNTIALRDAAQGQDPLLLTNYVSAVRIIYSEGQPQRSLMFGFVTLNNLNDAQYAVEQLQSKMFMGRKLKVQFSNTRNGNNGNDQAENVGFQVHVGLQSYFPENAIKIPTEEFLRDIFTPFGETLLDVAVKDYSSSPHRQEGYAFATFASEQIAETVIQQYNGFSKDGITLDCTWSHRSNHLKKTEYFFQVRAASLGLPTTGTTPNGSGTASLKGNSSNNSIASMIDRQGLVDSLTLDSLRLSNSPARSISPLDQMSMNSFPVTTQSQGSALPESLRPSALDINLRLDGLFTTSVSPSSMASSRDALRSTDYSSDSSALSGLYSGSYSNSVTPTAASAVSRSEVPQSYQRSLPMESFSNFSDLTGLSATHSYRGPAMHVHGEHGVQHGNAIPRSPIYGQQHQDIQSMGLMGASRQVNRHPSHPNQRNPAHLSHDMYYPAQTNPHFLHHQEVSRNGYHDQMYPNIAPKRQNEFHMNDNVFHNLPIHQHYSQPATSLSAMAMRGNLSNQPLKSLSTFTSGYKTNGNPLPRSEQLTNGFVGNYIFSQ